MAQLAACLGALGAVRTLVPLAIAAVVFVRRPALVPPAVLLAAPFRMPIDVHGGHIGLVHVHVYAQRRAIPNREHRRGAVACRAVGGARS